MTDDTEAEVFPPGDLPTGPKRWQLGDRPRSFRFLGIDDSWYVEARDGGADRSDGSGVSQGGFVEGESEALVRAIPHIRADKLDQLNQLDDRPRSERGFRRISEDLSPASRHATSETVRRWTSEGPGASKPSITPDHETTSSRAPIHVQKFVDGHAQGLGVSYGENRALLTGALDEDAQRELVDEVRAEHGSVAGAFDVVDLPGGGEESPLAVALAEEAAEMDPGEVPLAVEPAADERALSPETVETLADAEVPLITHHPHEQTAGNRRSRGTGHVAAETGGTAVFEVAFGPTGDVVVETFGETQVVTWNEAQRDRFDDYGDPVEVTVGTSDRTADSEAESDRADGPLGRLRERLFGGSTGSANEDAPVETPRTRTVDREGTKLGQNLQERGFPASLRTEIGAEAEWTALAGDGTDPRDRGSVATATAVGRTVLFTGDDPEAVADVLDDRDERLDDVDAVVASPGYADGETTDRLVEATTPEVVVSAPGAEGVDRDLGVPTLDPNVRDPETTVHEVTLGLGDDGLAVENRVRRENDVGPRPYRTESETVVDLDATRIAERVDRETDVASPEQEPTPGGPGDR